MLSDYSALRSSGKSGRADAAGILYHRKTKALRITPLRSVILRGETRHENPDAAGIL
jgi:hypothetical protein